MLEPAIEELERRAKLVADDLNGIQPHTLIFYNFSIRYSAERCLDAFLHYNEIRKNEEIDPDYLVSVVQEAVGHAAALSRYFWPSPGGGKKQPQMAILKKKRGEYLRKQFKLDNNSPLYNRSLRNAWEHFDERLDEFLIKTVAGMFFPTAIIGSHHEADDPISKVFKLLDPDEECLVLMGEKFFFAPIRDEVLNLYKNLRKK